MALATLFLSRQYIDFGLPWVISLGRKIERFQPSCFLSRHYRGCAPRSLCCGTATPKGLKQAELLGGGSHQTPDASPLGLSLHRPLEERASGAPAQRTCGAAMPVSP